MFYILLSHKSLSLEAVTALQVGKQGGQILSREKVDGFWGSLSLCLSPLQCSALRTLVFLSSMDSQFHLNSGRPQGSIYIPFPCSKSWEHFQLVTWCNHWAYFTCIPSFKAHTPTLPIAQYLKTVISYNFFFPFLSFQLLKKSRRVNLVHWTPSLPEMEFSLFLIFKK